MKKYIPQEFEAAWVRRWEEEQVYKTVDGSRQTVEDSNKQYVLVMFPYPSGAGLHVGHVRVYTGSDVIARYFRMVGKNVMYPMGWDAFGLPAENAAIKAKTNPMNLVPQYIATFKRQIKSLGFSYDWDREFATIDPDYYKWTQWLFIEMFKMGLLYKKITQVYFCDFCKTGLAEEEVLPNGTHERCGNPITKKDLPQWIFRITTYADRLEKDLIGLDWPKGILEMQKNWIGKKEGINITYDIVAADTNVVDTITCFTTRPDTNFGATFLVLAPEHDFVKKIADGKLAVSAEVQKEVTAYVRQSLGKTDVERQLEGRKKTGAFTGFYALNNLNGRRMPVWVSDFVLSQFGTGAVVGVPGHDMRDFEFARTFNILVLRVVAPATRVSRSYLMGADRISDEDLKKIGVTIVEKIHTGARKIEIDDKNLDAYKQLVKERLSPGFWNEVVGETVWFLFKEKDGSVSEYILNTENTPVIAALCSRLNDDPIEKTSNIWMYLAENDWYTPFIIQEEQGTMENSDFLNGMNIHDATKKIMDHMEETKMGKRVVTYHLRDWIFSRQRYWGEPIPMVHCERCAANKISYWDTETGSQELHTYKLRLQSERESDEIRKKNHTYVHKAEVKEEDVSRTAVFNTIVSNIQTAKDNLYGWFPVDQKALPVELPKLASYEPSGTGESPLAKVSEWIGTPCPHCGADARRESDTMPNWAGSCWYFIRFADPQNAQEPWSQDAMKRWLPVDWYVGGAEHAVLHLLYSRFWVKALYDLGHVNFIEPFKRLRTVGMVIAEDHRKMSKSFGNVINPDDVAAEFGADALRVYEMFMAPFNQENAWSTAALQGAYRFLKRVWDIFQEQYASKSQDGGSVQDTVNKELIAKLNFAIAKVSRDIPDFKFNTPIAALMEFMNIWEDAARNLSATSHKPIAPVLPVDEVKKFLQLLAPFAPFVTEEIWRTVLGEKQSIHRSQWPAADEKAFHHANVHIPVQVNGKMRGVIVVPATAEKEEVIRAAESYEKISKQILGKVYDAIYVKGKILNFVLKA